MVLIRLNKFLAHLATIVYRIQSFQINILVLLVPITQLAQANLFLIA
jgi:hypothetical protein